MQCLVLSSLKFFSHIQTNAISSVVVPFSVCGSACFKGRAWRLPSDHLAENSQSSLLGGQGFFYTLFALKPVTVLTPPPLPFHRRQRHAHTHSIALPIWQKQKQWLALVHMHSWGRHTAGWLTELMFSVPPFTEPKKRQCRALFDYQPVNEDELELKVGDIIEIIEEVQRF